MAIKVSDDCTGCGICVDVCPVGAITLVDDKAQVNNETCSDCGACVSECPCEALTQE